MLIIFHSIIVLSVFFISKTLKDILILLHISKNPVIQTKKYITWKKVTKLK